MKPDRTILIRCPYCGTIQKKDTGHGDDCDNPLCGGYIEAITWKVTWKKDGPDRIDDAREYLKRKHGI